MFKIVESLILDPIRILSPLKSRVKPGSIGQLKEFDGNIVCELSDGTRPFGIVGDVIYTDSKYKFIQVFPQRMVFKTNEYEWKKNYSGGCSLYVSKNGRFTSEKPFKDALCVAKMISPPDERKGYFEALWL